MGKNNPGAFRPPLVIAKAQIINFLSTQICACGNLVFVWGYIK